MMVGFAIFVLLGIFSPSENSMRYCVEYLTGRSIRGMDITKKNVDEALLNLKENLMQRPFGYDDSQVVNKEACELAREWRRGKKMILVMFPRKYPERRDPIFVVPTRVEYISNGLYLFDCTTAQYEVPGENPTEYHPSYIFSSKDRIKGVILLKKPKKTSR